MQRRGKNFLPCITNATYSTTRLSRIIIVMENADPSHPVRQCFMVRFKERDAEIGVAAETDVRYIVRFAET